MITTRDELLTAVRRAEITPRGLRIGDCAFVGGKGKGILFQKVLDETARRALINRIKMASSSNFTKTSLWELPCLARTSSSKQSTPKAKAPKKKSRGKASK